MKPLRGARHGARPLTAPSTAALRKLRLASQRSAENSIGTSEESSIGIDTQSQCDQSSRVSCSSPERKIVLSAILGDS